MSFEITSIVYFLGSGASKASKFDLPTMDHFFETDFFTEEKKEEYKNLKKFIKDNRISSNKLNMEEVITYLDLSIDNLGRFGEFPGSYLIEARKDFEKYLIYRLSVKEGENDNQPMEPFKDGIHAKLFNNKILQPWDSIVTLNYDCIIENTLSIINHNRINTYHELLQPYGRTDSGNLEPLMFSHLHSNHLGNLIKLHGSLDWFYCSNTLCTNHQVVSPKGEHKFLFKSEYSFQGEFCVKCGAPAMRVIVPPTMNKSFEKFPKLGFLWSLAHLKLKEAQIIVFWGVSFAESDYYLKWLIKSSITKNQERKPQIIIINKKDKDYKPNKNKCDLISRVYNITGIKADFFCETIDEYLGWLKEKHPEDGRVVNTVL